MPYRLPLLPQTPAPRLHPLPPVRKAAMKTLQVLREMQRSCSRLERGGRTELHHRAPAVWKSAPECERLHSPVCILKHVFTELSCNAQHRRSCENANKSCDLNVFHCLNTFKATELWFMLKDINHLQAAITSKCALIYYIIFCNGGVRSPPKDQLEAWKWLWTCTAKQHFGLSR